MNKNAFKIAWKALAINKVRTFLSVLGVVIGIAVVIVVVSAGEGIKNFVLGQLEVFGTNFIEIEVKVPNVSKTSTQNAGGIVSGISITTLTEDDAKAIKNLSNIEDVYAAQLTQDLVSYKGDTKKALLLGVNANYIDIDNGQVEKGRFFTSEEEAGLAKVAVLGKDVSDKLFGLEDPIGKYMTIKRAKYQIVGVMESRGSAMFFNWDDVILLPLKTVQKTIMGVDHVMYMIANYYDQSRAEDTAEEIRMLLRQRHDIPIGDPDKDDFAVTTMAEAMDLIEKVLGGITLLLIAIVAISLLVGGIGITNVMYVAVTERTYEIGLRKALGATKKDILNQFLIEAVAITFMGGLIGVIAGILFSYIIAVIAAYQGFDWGFVISIKSIIGACAFSIALGIVFGIFPARRAASLNPIQAIRYE